MGRTWIDSNLTYEEQKQLIGDALALSGNPTGEEIRELVLEMKGEAPSVQSCINWKNGSFEFYKAELEAAANQAQQIAAIAQAGVDLSQANATISNQMIYEALLTRRASGQEITPKELSTFTLAQSRVRIGEQRERLLQLKIEQQQFDAAKAVVEHLAEFRAIVDDRGLNTAEKVARVRERLWGEPPKKGSAT